ncbi:MAG: MerR family transcriptional regulator [Actinomycetota bacterium]
MSLALTVAKLAVEASVRPDTVRYYERAGLLPAAPRSPSGYRLYGEEAVDRLRFIIRFIKGVQSFGLRLREVRALLEVMDRGLCPCGHTEALVRSRIAELDADRPAPGRQEEAGPAGRGVPPRRLPGPGVRSVAV